MIELPLIFMAGFVGSSHCIGMCGPFAAILGSVTTNWKHNVAWQLLYSAGRIFTYTALGAMAGFGGQRLAGLKLFGINAPAALALAAGLFLIYEGLTSAHVIRRPQLFPSLGAAACPTGGLLRSMLQQQSRTGVFLAGLATGLLPCGLVYALLLTAARSGNLFLGAMIMAVFGLGTTPVMVATGVSASLTPVQWRAKMFTIAGWCIVLVGVISLYRGWIFLTVDDPAACPFCS